MKAAFVKGNVGEAYETIFKASFGDLPNGAVIYDPAAGIDVETKEGGIKPILKEYIEKVATSGTIPAIPVMVDREIVDKVKRETPVLNMIRRRAHKGAVVKYNVLTAIGDRAGFVSESDAINGNFPEADATYAAVTEDIKISIATGAVGGFAQAADEHYIDLYREEVAHATTALKLLHENAVLNGDSTSNANEYDGLLKRVPSANITDASGAALTLDMLIDAIEASRETYPAGQLAIITDYQTAAKIKKLAMDKVSYVNPVDLNYGLRTVEIDGVPIIPSRFMPESDETNHYHQALVVNFDFVEFRVLQEPMLVEKAVTADARSFFVKEYSTLIHKFPETMQLVKDFSL